MSSDLALRSSISDICARHDLAIQQFSEAYDAFAAANALLVSARRQTWFVDAKQNRFALTKSRRAPDFLKEASLPDKEEFLKAARHETAVDVWAYLVEATGLFRLMDKQAKDQFSDGLITDPPEVTEDNIAATFEKFYFERDLVFKRGIANVFSRLDRRFRSHDGWKIGSRIILTRVFDENGFWNYRSSERDAITDIERTFALLDGADPATIGSLIEAVDTVRRAKSKWGPMQAEVETDYFRIRTFINGNAHLWFKRKDLVEQVNKLLADYYGAVVPDDHDDGADEVLRNYKMTPARNFGFFPSPKSVVGTVTEEAHLYERRPDADPLIILEPSAGTGQISSAAAAFGHTVDCIEIQPDMADQLRSSGLYRNVWTGDFLMMRPEPRYDLVLMNPPFDRERDIDHVSHAWGFVKPGGRLVAVMSASTEFRSTKKSEMFRALAERFGGRWRDLPPGSFSEAGTNCNTLILVLRKPALPVQAAA